MRKVSDSETGEPDGDIDALLVDDDTAFLRLCTRFFERYGPEINLSTCEDPEKALELIEDEGFECVLSDYKMPGMNGIELLEAVRDKYPDLPFIMVTSEGNEDVASKAISAGVTDYFLKEASIDYMILVKRIKEAVRKNRIASCREKERNEYEQTLRALHKANQELVEAKTEKEVALLTKDIAVDVLEIQGTGIYLFDDQEESLRPAANSDYLKEVFGGMPVFNDEVPSLTWHIFHEGQTRVVDDLNEVEITYTDEIPLKSGVWVPIDGHGIIAFLSEEKAAFDQQDRNLIELLASSAESALNRIERKREHEKVLDEFRSAARDIFCATSSKEISERVVETIEEVLNISGVVIYRYDENDDRLFPEAESAEADFMRDSFPEIPADHSSITGHHHSTGEPGLYSDIRESEYIGKKTHDETNMRAGVFAPMGRNGILVAGSKQIGSFNSQTLNLVELLAGAAKTAYKRVEREQILRERQKELKLFETILNNIKDGVYVLDQDYDFVFVNQAYTELTGFNEEELIGRSASKIVGQEVVSTSAEKVKELESGESAVLEAEMSTADDREIIGESQFVPLKDDDGDYAGKIGVVRDITAQKKLEQELQSSHRETREMARSMIEAVDDYAIFRIDPEGNVASWNEGAEKIKGYTHNEIIGEHFSKFYTEEERQNRRPERNLGKAAENGKAHDQGWRVRKDGRRFLADITINAIRDEDGEIEGYTKVTQDISERRKRREEMERQLEEFSSLISHDLRNPLNLAQGYLELAKETGRETDFKKAEEALERMNSLISDLQIITMRPDKMEKQQVSLKDIFSEACSMVDKEGKTCEVENTAFVASRTSLLRLIGNLIKNSVEHNENKVKIEAGPLEDCDGFYYQDNGKGIPEETRSQAMEQGFTTSDGRGLGLYIVKRIGDLHDWDITLTESDTGGVCFEFRF